MAGYGYTVNDEEIDEHNENEDIDNSHLYYENKNLYIRLNNQERFPNNLKRSYADLLKGYPKLFAGDINNEQLEYLFDRVFAEGLLMKCYVTNLSFINANDRDVKILALRPAKEGVFLNETLPDGIALRFKGRVYAGGFIIDDIHTTSDSGYRDFEVEIEATPFHTENPGNWKDFFLYNLLEYAKSITEHTGKNLEEWNAYLSWKRAMSERRIAGCKYYKVDCDYESRQLEFSLICEGEEEFNTFQRFVKRNSIEVFSNDYSLDTWHFKFNPNPKFNQRGIKVGGFKKIIEKYYLHENTDKLSGDMSYVDYENDESKYRNDNEEYTGSINETIEDMFENPYIVKVAFDLNEEDSDEIREKDMDEVEVEDYIREEVLSDYYSDGFLAISAVGDLALIRRFEKAIEQLKNDENYSPNLALWLFDVTKAQLPDQTKKIEVSHWLNQGIAKNEDQKEAVIKMLNSPDLCLIQGPPGTGKTTVIAEAIYQFVIRGNRVLLASQANLAVDNALERLAFSPDIRAIRLGKTGKKGKVSDDVKKLTEENALKYFYDALAQKIDDEWLSKWSKLDASKLQYEKDMRDATLLVKDSSDLQKAMNDAKESLSFMLSEKDRLRSLMEKIRRENQDINNEKIQGARFLDFIRTGQQTNCALSAEQLDIVFSEIKPLLACLITNNVVLNPIPLEVSPSSKLIILNNGLVMTFESYWLLEKLKQRIENCDSNSLGNNDEISILERQKAAIEQKLDDDDSDELVREWRTVKKRINEIKNLSNSFALSNTEKQLFTEDFINELNGPDALSRLKAIFSNITSQLSELKSFADRIDRVLTQHSQNNQVSDYSSIEKEIMLNSAKIQGTQSELSNKKTSLDRIHAEFKKLVQRYQADSNESEITISNLVSSIQDFRRQNDANIQLSSEMRNNWEALITGFTRKLTNEKSVKYDKEYYQDIYINACNVVGISCTENVRSLADKGYKEFDVVIIDEVSKATPPELLIPLMKGRKAILVGDHRQLPPLFNEHEKSYKEMMTSIDEADEEVKDLITEENFKRFKNMVTASLFKSYFENADPEIKHSLLTQYRMHSDIMNVINRFYDNRLKAGFSPETEKTAKSHDLTIRGIDGLSFITPDKHAYWIDSSQFTDGTKAYESRPEYSTSCKNLLECHIIIELLKKMGAEYIKMGYGKQNAKTVGVISFYQLQVNELKNMLKKERNNFDFSALNIDINTVDRFQGKEKAIVITSLVRHTKSTRRNEGSHIAAFERINVAFSRAQEMLVIVGAKDMYFNQPVVLPNMDSEGEKTVPVYKNIIDDLNRNACFYDSAKIIMASQAKAIMEAIKELGGKL